MGILAQNVRFALRVFQRAPAFAAAAVLTLAVGIGANTSIFSVANALLLRPLPYRQADRLVLIDARRKSSSNISQGPLSVPRFEQVEQRNRSFSAMAAFTPDVFNLTRGGDPEQTPSARVSWKFLDVLGIAPAMGRGFRAEEDNAGGDPVVMISDALRQRRFARGAAVIGRTITLDSRDYTIIGVLPPDFRFAFFGPTADIVAPRVFELNSLSPGMVQAPIVNIQQVTPGYASAMRIPLRHGREFTERDDAKAPRVVMVNETLARLYWPNENPVGKHILLGRRPVPAEIVGVLGDVPNLAVGTDPQAEIYVLFAQPPSATQNLIVRTAGNPRGLTAVVPARVLALDRDQPVTGVQTMDEVLEAGAAQPRFTTYLLGGLSATAFLLSMMGIYGVIAYSVAERTQEMGIRIALGADGRDILRLVLGHGLLLAGTGIAIGLAALALTRLMSSLLYHVSVTDPATFIAGPALFAAAALAASYLPARRAMRVDPVIALRADLNSLECY